MTDIPASRRKQGKPELFCVFCKRIKHFDSLSGLWGHVIHKHDGIDTPQRLREICRTAESWVEYWTHNSDGGKRGSATLKRLEQVMRGDFSWDVVLGWNLRG